ncbi:MAG: flippase-like domain-containing protein [Magnetospirillum sp.]|nr:flippase-like domain-containing protein [Magnetospirillum sp.]MBI3708009.1 flippase-like domain-containing protein [Pseudomonadota bacterium]
MKAGAIRLALIAAVLAVAWWLRDGFGDVQGALDTAGWSGVALMAVTHILPLILCGLAWGSLQDEMPSRVFMMGRWIKDGVGELAGFLPLSGEMAAIRMMTRHGFRFADASAIVVVDVTSEAIAQFFFSLLGVGMWLWLYPQAEVTRWALIALAISVPGLAAFVALQRSAVVRFLETLPSKIMPHAWDAPDADAGVHAAIHALYSDRRRIARSVGWHILAWAAGAIEAWVALRLLGHPMGIAEVLALESIIYAIRSVAFVIPGAIGLQEGGYMLVGAALGLPTELALAVSLLKRGRELMMGLPALLAWHFVEGAAKAKAPPAETPKV